ncbi:hypothetical protein RRG08_008609 [Elysia crispata]|uniref:Uncharacterized protein n=1 Tax=Elysia crispata TaxID=231223 RepID=A0AAE1B775_9GAST|nr:hypothetical protein RRG08_008609 [Elysia crispata]
MSGQAHQSVGRFKRPQIALFYPTITEGHGPRSLSCLLAAIISSAPGRNVKNGPALVIGAHFEATSGKVQEVKLGAISLCLQARCVEVKEEP